MKQFGYFLSRHMFLSLTCFLLLFPVSLLHSESLSLPSNPSLSDYTLSPAPKAPTQTQTVHEKKKEPFLQWIKKHPFIVGSVLLLCVGAGGTYYWHSAKTDPAITAASPESKAAQDEMHHHSAPLTPPASPPTPQNPACFSNRKNNTPPTITPFSLSSPQAQRNSTSSILSSPQAPSKSHTTMGKINEYITAHKELTLHDIKLLKSLGTKSLKGIKAFIQKKEEELEKITRRKKTHHTYQQKMRCQQTIALAREVRTFIQTCAPDRRSVEILYDES